MRCLWVVFRVADLFGFMWVLLLLGLVVGGFGWFVLLLLVSGFRVWGMLLGS